ncbi:MAG: elongation factor 4 [Chloroflexi bacterium]|nr:elongation factor 4 [Chloroflexota bacterium]
MDQRNIRNFSIIAHIDHGKSTLADRLLERTQTVAPREMQDQLLDQMDLERERGITIKAQAVRMLYTAKDGKTCQLNLIDTPGHVDFSYEVSRSLAACEGAILVVDASQGIQAQTLAHTFLAMQLGLRIVPVVNKIDLLTADPRRVTEEMGEALAIPPEEVIYASAKEGIGIEEVLGAVVRMVPSPRGDPAAPLRALVFDSKYDPYKGVIAYVRVFDGSIPLGEPLRLMSTGRTLEPLETGIFTPWLAPVAGLGCGEVGYVATGLKDVRECRVGDTLTLAAHPAAAPLPGYRPLKPMVFAGFYPAEGTEYEELRDALAKLQLNDAALTYEAENSLALGFGFRCGFLGLLHMEIVQERLEREYGLQVLITAPSVGYEAERTDGVTVLIRNPAELPDPARLAAIREPWIAATILAPQSAVGAVMELMNERRAIYGKMEYIQAAAAAAGQARVVLEYEMPLAEMLADFFDQLKSRTQGYASLDYEVIGSRESSLVRLDVLVNEQPVDALSTICHRDEAYARGRALVARLRQVIPRQLFDVPIQAAVGGHIIARETVRALRKNVLAKCYGGDVTRKRKLLEKQAEGKKRMRRIGRVEVPQEAFLAVLRLGQGQEE